MEFELKRGDKVRVSVKNEEHNAYFYRYMGEDKQYVLTTEDRPLKDDFPENQAISVHRTENVRRKAL